MIETLISWAQDRALALEHMGLVTEVTVGPVDYEPRSVSLYLQSAVDGATHTIWDSGESDLLVVDADSLEEISQFTRHFERLAELDEMLDVALADLHICEHPPWHDIEEEPPVG